MNYQLTLNQKIELWLPALGKNLYNEFFLNPYFLIPVFLFILIDYHINKHHQTIGKTLLFDSAFYFLNIVFSSALTLFILYEINLLLNQFALNYSPKFLTELSPALEIIFGLLMIDFLFYWSHRLKHKINLLWKFHTIHHYSGTLSFLSRNHPLDLIPMKILSLVPMAVLSSSFKSLAITYLIYNLYQFFLHSNSNISLGPLNHILVSPKYHRIHHLVDSKYANKNFASFFSFYDLFFNTQLMPKKNTAYNKMQTGVHGLKHENFRSLKLIDLPRAFLQQVMLKIPKE